MVEPELYVVGNKIVFHKYRVNCSIPIPQITSHEPVNPEELRKSAYWSLRRRLRKCRIESYGILCDDEEELKEIEAILKEFGIPYTIEDISPTPEQLTRAKEIDGRVGSRSEALKYIMGKNHNSGPPP